MAKRSDHRHDPSYMGDRLGRHPDPEYLRWRRKYPRFPGVDECARVIRAGDKRGAWAEIIAHELASNAGTCLPALIAAFRNDSSDDVRLYVMMALDIARLEESVPFLAEVLGNGDPRFTPYAERALQGISTREARAVLWKANHPGPDASPDTPHHGPLRPTEGKAP
jgi:hypothetical protein